MRNIEKAPADRAEAGGATRSLIYVPIIHTQEDMGGLGQLVQRLKVRKLGRSGWKHNANLINRSWTDIEKRIEELNLPYERVLVYQDGLPVCGKETELVARLAEAGSRNQQLVLRLQQKGATIVGTESAELLVEEYELMKHALASEERKDLASRGRQTALTDSLLRRRDQYIAERINGSLKAGDVGILFLGMSHSVEKWLDGDIRVIRLESLYKGAPFGQRLQRASRER